MNKELLLHAINTLMANGDHDAISKLLLGEITILERNARTTALKTHRRGDYYFIHPLDLINSILPGPPIVPVYAKVCSMDPSHADFLDILDLDDPASDGDFCPICNSPMVEDKLLGFDER